jgi:hypothetical protein
VCVCVCVCVCLCVCVSECIHLFCFCEYLCFCAGPFFRHVFAFEKFAAFIGFEFFLVLPRSVLLFGFRSSRHLMRALIAFSFIYCYFVRSGDFLATTCTAATRYYCSGQQTSLTTGTSTSCSGSTACEPGKICNTLGMTAGVVCPVGYVQNFFCASARVCCS